MVQLEAIRRKKFWNTTWKTDCQRSWADELPSRSVFPVYISFCPCSAEHGIKQAAPLPEIFPFLLPAALVRACEECSGEDKQVIIRPARCRVAAGHTSEARLFIAKRRRVHLPMLKQFTAAVIHEPSRATCFAACIFLGERKGNSCF